MLPGATHRQAQRRRKASKRVVVLRAPRSRCSGGCVFLERPGERRCGAAVRKRGVGSQGGGVARVGAAASSESRDARALPLPTLQRHVVPELRCPTRSRRVLPRVRQPYYQDLAAKKRVH